MAQKLEHTPGALAPIAGVYEQLNVMGQPVGIRSTLAKNQLFPAAPFGHTWTLTAAEHLAPMHTYQPGIDDA